MKANCPKQLQLKEGGFTCPSNNLTDVFIETTALHYHSDLFLILLEK